MCLLKTKADLFHVDSPHRMPTWDVVTQRIPKNNTHVHSTRCEHGCPKAGARINTKRVITPRFQGNRYALLIKYTAVGPARVEILNQSFCKP